MSTYEERKKKFSVLHFLLFSKLNRERERESSIILLVLLSRSRIYVYASIYTCVIHHYNIVLVVATEEQKERRDYD